MGFWWPGAGGLVERTVSCLSDFSILVRFGEIVIQLPAEMLVEAEE